MNLFHIVTDCQAIICTKGVFRQVDVYRREDKVYAKVGTGHVRLEGFPGTSVPGISWVDIEHHESIALEGPAWFCKPEWVGNT